MRTAIMAITTSSSISVKPERGFMVSLPGRCANAVAGTGAQAHTRKGCGGLDGNGVNRQPRGGGTPGESVMVEGRMAKEESQPAGTSSCDQVNGGGGGAVPWRASQTWSCPRHSRALRPTTQTTVV